MDMVSCYSLTAWAQAAMEPPCPRWYPCSQECMCSHARTTPCPTPDGPMWLHGTPGNMDPGGHGYAWQTDGQRTRLHGVMGRPGPVPAGLIETVPFTRRYPSLSVCATQCDQSEHGDRATVSVCAIAEICSDSCQDIFSNRHRPVIMQACRQQAKDNVSHCINVVL